jgi:hypothetical protein
VKTIQCKLCGRNLTVLNSLGSGGKIMSQSNSVNNTGHTADCPASYSYIIDADKYLAMSKKEYLEHLRKEILDRIDSAEIDIENIDLLLGMEDE